MSKSSKAWLHEHVSDRFVRQARREGYRSRAAYKLLELARQDQLIRPGMLVVDLGAAPGGWSQVAAELTGPKGRVLAVDILDMPTLPGVRFIRGDFQDEATRQALHAALGGQPVDLVVSDMAPNISGIGMVDQARAAQLVELAAAFAIKYLKPGGNFLVKGFQGAGYGELRGQLQRHFRRVLTRKPAASRSRSSEMYLLAKELIATPPGSPAAG